jgi:myxalamid-type polyketide synthase MxaE and MxaD
VSVILSPEGTVYFCKLHVMAPDGRCKTFDARADGYVRSEGCGMVVLKRLSDAVADRDNILAVIRGSAMNHDGRSQGLTAPNGLAQRAVIRQALINAGVTPDQISYVETHGTGTALGDPIEVQALADVLRHQRPDQQPVWIGGVKTNIGHAEAAAGIAGLIKVVLALQHQELPPHLHLTEPNPHVDWQHLPFAIPTERTAWPGDGTRLVAGLSSFGFSGTNVHTIVEEAPQESRPSGAGAPTERTYLLPLSAPGPDAIKAVAAAYHDFLTDGATKPPLADICYTASVRRSHHDDRLALVGEDPEELVEQLEAFLRGGGRPNASARRLAPGRRPKVVFVFPGQGAQWLGMGRELLEREPVFRQTLEACDQALRPYVDWSLLEQLAADDSETRLIGEIDVIQPTLFAIQVALAALWRSWGVEPNAVVGHSLGEVAAAYVAGTLTMDEAAHVISLRSRLMRRVSGRGAMAVVGLPLAETEEVLVGREDRLSVAVSNGPRSTVVSGDPQAVEEVLEILDDRGVFCRPVKVDVAAHSPQMDPLRPQLVDGLQGLAPQAGSVPIYSTVRSALTDGHDLDASYWGDNLRRPVCFWSVVEQLVTSGHDVFVEISPHPLLVKAIEGALRELDAEGIVVPSLRRQAREQAAMLDSLGALYASGSAVAWHKLHPGGRLVSLPTYPWQHRRFWLHQDETAPAARPLRAGEDRSGLGMHPLLGRHLALADGSDRHVWQTELGPQFLPYLGDHRVYGAALLPASAYLEMALGAAADVFGDAACALQDVAFHRALYLPEQGARQVQVILSSNEAEGASFHVHSRRAGADGPGDSWKVHATGRIRLIQEDVDRAVPDAVALADLRKRCSETMSAEDYYEELGRRNIDYGPAFRHIARILRRDKEALVQLSVPEEHASSGGYQVHPAILDNCFQVLAAALRRETADERKTYMPTHIEQVRVYDRLDAPLWGYARLRQSATQDDRQGVEGDVRLLDGEGRTVVQALGLRFQPVTYEAPPIALDDMLYEVKWQPQERPAAESPRPDGPGSWLIFADSDGVGEGLAGRLEAAGETCVLVSPGETYEQVDDRRWQVRPGQPEDLVRPIDVAMAGDSPALRGIVHLWSLDAPSSENMTVDALERAQRLGCGSVAHLIQQLDRYGEDGKPSVWLVTRGAQPAPEAGEVLAVSQSPLWGFGRTMALEQADRWGGLVDLDPQVAADDAGEQLWEAVWHADEEDQVAFRRGRRYVARLLRWEKRAEPLPALTLRSDASYLVTGGLGDLGLEVASWMVEQGARHLILLQRTKLPPRAAWDEVEPGTAIARRIATVRQLETRGAEVRLGAVDVADEAQLRCFLEQHRRTDGPPIRGVVHAAGVVEPQLLVHMDPASLIEVLRPKVMGGWSLHQHLSGVPLDFFVLFSSVAALLSSPLLGSYAAANAFLDALAHYRRARGEPALSISWGSWSKKGMTARYQDREGRKLLPRGIDTLTPAQGIEALQRLLRENPTQVAVVRVDWREWGQYHPSTSSSPMVSILVPEPASLTVAGREGAEDERPIADRLREIPAARHQQMLEDDVRRGLAGVLHMKPESIPTDRNVMELGLDSIMVMELMRQLERGLQIKLYPREIFERPSVGALAEYLATEFQRATGVGVSGDAVPAMEGASDALLSLLIQPDRSRSLARPVERNPGMVFLLSAPRSGSTLLRVMLAGHPDLFSPPELHLLPFDTMQERDEELGLTYLGEGLQRAFMSLMQVDAEESAALIQDLTSRNASVQEVYAKLQDLAGPRLLIDKSPSYGASSATLERAEALFEGNKYIHLVRHPYAMIESAVRIRLHKLLSAGEVDPYAFAEQIWTLINGNVLDFIRQIDAQRGLLVRYEDLVSQPTSVTQHVCEFLGIPFDQALVKPYEGKRMTDGVHGVSWGVGDPNFLKRDRIESALGDAWRDIVLPRPLGEKARRLAAELTYELPREGEADVLQRGRERRRASEAPTPGIGRVAREGRPVKVSSRGELELPETLKEEILGREEGGAHHD